METPKNQKANMDNSLRNLPTLRHLHFGKIASEIALQHMINNRSPETKKNNGFCQINCTSINAISEKKTKKTT